MDSIKKIGAGCSLLFALLLGTAATPAEAAFDGLQAMEVTRLSGGLKSTEAETGVIDSTESYKYIINENGTAEITDYLKEEENVEIPPMLDGHPVTVIQNRAFDNCRELEKIFIPDSILKIGSRAFEDCWELEKIFIPQNVEEIDGNIVEDAKKLTKIEVDARNAFYTSKNGILYNKDMTELLIVPGGKDMASFQFPDSVVCIGEDAFYGNQSASFTGLIIPDKITTIRSGAFARCKNLRKAVIGKNVKKIPNCAFFKCYNLSEIVMSNRIQIIGIAAFDGCHLHKINIPDNVTEIGEDAFLNCCYSLKDITIPRSVTKMEYWGIGYDEEREVIPGVTITGYRDTAAYQYAKKYSVAFRDIETGKSMRFDLVSVPIPKEKITVLKARKKKIELEYYPEEDVAYQIAIRKASASSWKKYNKTKTWASIRGLKPGKRYHVKVRAWREIDGKYYYGKWSKVKKVTVR